jgi:hypothetical protein
MFIFTEAGNMNNSEEKRMLFRMNKKEGIMR